MRVMWPTQRNQADITIASIPIMLCICKTSVFGILSCHCTRPWVTLGDLAKYWMTRSVARCLCDSWATCFIVVFHCSCLYLVLCLRHSTSINGVPLKSGLGVTRHWYCEFMRDLYTTLISTDARISFVADSVSIFHLILHSQLPKKTIWLRYDRSRSSQVIKIDINRKHCDLQFRCKIRLSVIVSAILRFIGRKSAFFRGFDHLSLLWSRRQRFSPVTKGTQFCVKKLESLTHSTVKTAWSMVISFDALPFTSVCRADGRTNMPSVSLSATK